MIIDDDIFTKEEKRMVEKEILSNNFPWFVQPYSTSTKFPFFSHIGLARNTDKPNSHVFYVFKEMTERFCRKHKIKIKIIHRHSLNLTHCFPKYTHTDPHVDHNFKHKVIMFYLNDVSGNTLIFNKKHKKGEPHTFLLEKKPDYKILYKIKPKQFRVACFDGKYFHAAEFPKNNQQRIVSVSTFS